METHYEFQGKAGCTPNFRWAIKGLLSMLFFFTLLSAQAQVMIPYQSSWKYAPECTSSPASDWKTPEFNETGWQTGNAAFGFGPQTYGTVLQRGPNNQTPNYPAYYLRKKFTVNNLASISNLLLQARVDDGVFIYLNGQEIIKTNNSTAYTYIVTGSAGRGVHRDMQLLNGSVKFIDDVGYDDNNTSKVQKVNTSNPPLDILTGDLTTKFYHEFGGSVELLFQENRLDGTFIKEPTERLVSSNNPKYIIADNYVVMKGVNNTSVLRVPNPGDEVSLRASWVGDYVWYSSDAPSQPIATGVRELKHRPNQTTTYYVRDGHGHLEDVFTVNVGGCQLSAPTLTANPAIVTVGSSSMLTASGCAGTVAWSHSLGTGNTKMVTPPNTTTYTATCTVGDCTSPPASVTVTVEPTKRCIYPPDECSGNSSEIRSYTINLAKTGSMPVELTYRSHEGPGQVRLRVNGGSWHTYGVGATSSGVPYITIPVGSHTFVAGNNIVELASGGGFICFRELCVRTASCLIPPPTVSANPTTVPSGGTSTLTASGCSGTVTWSHGLGIGNSKTVNPTTTTTYTATCTVGDCTSPNGSVTVESGPPPCLSLGDQCSGNSAEVRSYNLNPPSVGTRTLILTYRSHEGNSTGRIRINGGSWQTFSLTQSSDYRSAEIGSFPLSGTNSIDLASGGGFICFRELCVSTASCLIPPPTVSANPTTVPSGGTSTLTASGCSGTVTWSHDLGIGNSKTVNPTANTTYTATCTVGGCTSSASVTVNVSPCSSPVLSANPTTVPSGGTSTLTASGCSGTVTWSHGLGTGNSKTVNPTTTTTYTATCTVGDCTSPNGSVTVESGPPPCLSLGDQCSGNSAEVRSYNLNLATGESRELKLTYRSHEGNSTGRIRINGGSWQTFPLSQSSGYQSVGIGSFTLNSGNNSIELASGGGFICFRELCYEGDTPDCNFTAATSPVAIYTSVNSPVQLVATCSGAACPGVSYSWNGSGANCNTSTCSFNAPGTVGTFIYTVTLSKPGCPNQTAQVTVYTQPSGSCIGLNDQCSGNDSEIRTHSMNLPSGGTKVLTLTYRSHERNTSGRIRINGGAWQTFTLNQTPGDLSFMTVGIGNHNLNSGSNNIELASGGGFICFRELCADNISSRLGVGEEALPEVLELTVSPNPNNGVFEASFYVEPGRKAVLSVSDMQGREVWSKNLQGEGRQREFVQLPAQAVGSYILLLRKEATATTSKAEYKKVIVVK
jgi:hypothetical protein